MQNETPYSLITWDNVGNLPFPKEIKDISATIEWDKFEWHAIGLPVENAKYNMLGGKSLYLSEYPNGDIKVEYQSTFTGDILMGGYFVNENDKDGYNYFINFIVTILQGEVKAVEVQQLNKQSVKEYDSVIAEFQNDIRRVAKITSSWWFKYLYRPWFLIVRGVAYASLFVIKFINDAIVWLAKFVTPL